MNWNRCHDYREEQKSRILSMYSNTNEVINKAKEEKPLDEEGEEETDDDKETEDEEE